MKYLLSFRERPSGGAVVPGHLISGPGLGDWDQLTAEPSLTVLVHGYNVDFADGKRSLLAFASRLPSARRGGIVAVTWPGDHWTGPLSYSFEGRDADDTADALAKCLGDLPTRAPMALVGHSLGNRVIMRAIGRLAGKGFPIEQVCLMAAAIDDDSLAAADQYLHETRSARRVAVLWSRKDIVLRFAYPIGDLFQAFVFSADFSGLALGARGPQPHRRTGSSVPANVIAVLIPDGRQASHGDYLPADQPSAEQRSAAAFADAVIGSQTVPAYPPR